MASASFRALGVPVRVASGAAEPAFFMRSMTGRQMGRIAAMC